LNDTDLAFGVENADPVDDLIIVPRGTSGPLLLQQLGRG
jgi:hypothetical protein